jgi:hypothetical protein
MNPAARAVVVGGTMFATYIMFDLLVRMWHRWLTHTHRRA